MAQFINNCANSTQNSQECVENQKQIKDEDDYLDKGEDDELYIVVIPENDLAPSQFVRYIPNDFQSITGITFKNLLKELPYVTTKPVDTLTTLDYINYAQKQSDKLARTEVDERLIRYEYFKLIVNEGPSLSELEEKITPLIDTLSTAEKFTYAQYFGYRFSLYYNYNRRNHLNGENEGLVSIDKLLETSSNHLPGGVCRDIAVAQATLLHILGIKKAYVITYQITGSAHATLLGENPSNQFEWIHLNYNELNTSTTKGSTALKLSNSMPDVTMVYKIFDYDGSPLTFIPSEIGEISFVLAGKEITDLNPMLENSVSKIVSEVDLNKYSSISVALGKGISGDSFAGSALKINSGLLKEIISFEGSAGITHFNSIRSADLSLSGIALLFSYSLNMSKDFMKKNPDLNFSTRLNYFGQSSFMYATKLMKYRLPKSGWSSAQGQYLSPSIDFYFFKDNPLYLNLSFNAMFYLVSKDTRVSKDFMLKFNDFFTTSELKTNKNNYTLTLLGNRTLFNNFGQYTSFYSGVENKIWGGGAIIGSRFSLNPDNQINWIPQTMNALYLDLFYKVEPIKIKTEIDFDLNQKDFFTPKIKMEATIIF